MAEVNGDLAALIARIVRVPADQITAETEFDTFDDWSSFNALRLLVEVERRFGISLDLSRYLAAGTVGEVVDMLAAKR
jgi:acyl carrier protein